MGSSGGSSGSKEVRYAPYLESAHSELLNHGGSDTPNLSFIDVFNATLNKSPYADYTPLYYTDAFFGSGYEIKNFPTLYDMFGKFMGGIDVCDLYGEIYENIVHSPEINEAVSAQAALLDDDIEAKVLPRFLAGMRDINSVMSTSFVIGKGIIEDARVKAINKFASEIRLKAVDATIKVWERHLEWNKAVVQTYGEYAKLYYTVAMDVDRTNLEYAAKHELWNINLFDYARGILGAMQGAAASTGGGNEPSKVQGVIGGAMSGAAAGAMATGGNPIGAVVGGVLGLAASFF